MTLVPRIMELLKANGQGHVKVFLGGIIPDQDVSRLKEMGVTGIYGPGASTDAIVNDIHQTLTDRA
jgi:methylmalonyl-CoA mutase, C-terminal domain